MNFQFEPNPNKLVVYHEGPKRRILVGELTYNKKSGKYEFNYDKNYAHSKYAVPLSPELDLFHLKHVSEKAKVFDAFLDRIPERDNPAYKDYCTMQGISPDEENIIILLGTIGTRGPSSFIFELIYHYKFTAADIIHFREELQITQYDFALAFDIKQITLQRLESGVSADPNTLKRIQIILRFPEVALWTLRQTGRKLHVKTLAKLINFFETELKKKL